MRLQRRKVSPLLCAFTLANVLMVLREIFQCLCKLVFSLRILLCFGGLSSLQSAEPAVLRRDKLSATRLN